MNEHRYTKRAERTMEMAYREALSLGSSTIDTPHIARALHRQVKEIDWQQVGVEVGESVARAFMDALAEMEKAQT